VGDLKKCVNGSGPLVNRANWVTRRQRHPSLRAITDGGMTVARKDDSLVTAQGKISQRISRIFVKKAA
jgi:hypothetical protein